MIAAKDLASEPPRGPRERVGQYVILGRAIDKCRADLAGTIGSYHTNCPLDRMLLDWKGAEYEPFRAELAAGADDAAMARWIDEHGTPKSAQEVATWSQQLEGYHPYMDDAKREWFIGECEPLGLDPKTTTLFEFLEADDRQSFAN
jgi:hypothetical protein